MPPPFFVVKHRFMTTLIILAASALAILGLIGLNAWLGGWTPSRIASLDEALERIRQDYLDLVPGEAVMSADGKAALIADNGGQGIGLIVAQGDILVSRLLMPADISAARAEGAGLTLRLRDFTFPATRIELASEDEAAQWVARLQGAS